MNRLTALFFCLSALAVSHAQVTSYGLSVEVVAEHDSGVLSGMTSAAAVESVPAEKERLARCPRARVLGNGARVAGSQGESRVSAASPSRDG